MPSSVVSVEFWREEKLTDCCMFFVTNLRTRCGKLYSALGDGCHLSGSFTPSIAVDVGARGWVLCTKRSGTYGIDIANPDVVVCMVNR